MILYKTPLPVQAWEIEFDVLKRYVRTVGRGIYQIIFLKRGTHILEEQLRRQLTKTKLMSYKRRVVKLIGWKVAWKEGTCRHLCLGHDEIQLKEHKV